MLRSSALALALLAVPAAAQVQNPLAPDRWAGAYVNEQLRLELARQADGYAGALLMQGQRFPVSARPAGEKLEGTFTAQGHAFAFSATLEGATLVLVSDGATHRLTREAVRNPLAGAPARGGAGGAGGAGGGAASGGASAPADWQTYRHALGYTLRYPPGWQLQETELGLVIVPPDLARDAQGQPLELLALNAVAAQGVTRPDDPRAVQFVDASLAAAVPFLRREGQAVARAAGDRAIAELSYAGTNPMGRPVRALVQVALLGDQAVTALLLGEVERVRAREQVARRIFDTASIGEAQRDGRLVGAWRREKVYTSGDFSSTSVRTLFLRPDGTCRDAARTLASANHKDGAGDVTGSTSVDTGEGDPAAGRWAADGRRLILRWPDRTEEWTYQLGEGAILLRSGGGEPHLYERVR